MIVVNEFHSTGATHDLRVDNKGEGIAEEKVTRIKNHFQTNHAYSIRVASRELDIPNSYIQMFFKKVSFKYFKPYKPKQVNILLE